MDEYKAVRPEVEGFTPYTPGLTIEEIRRRHGLDTVIKLASNENPLGVSPRVQKVLREKADAVFRYPQMGYPRLRAAVAENLGIAPEMVIAGNGSDEIIDLLVRVKARPGLDNVLAFDPCFSVYGSQSRLCGVEFRQVPLSDDFSFPFGKLLAASDENTALVFVTSPDNPTGYATTAEELEAVARVLPPRALLVVDEAYIHFADEPERHTLLPRLAMLDNVAILRTFSKAYGLAGLRLGIGLAPPWLAQAVLKVQIPFSVNLLAEEAGLEALDDAVFLSETLRVTREGRARLAAGLEELSCRVWPSQANFLMFEPPAPAPEVFEALLARGIIVRPLTSYGLPGKIRVTVGAERENEAFLAALGEVL